jgi:hypothetical protein
MGGMLSAQPYGLIGVGRSEKEDRLCQRALLRQLHARNRMADFLSGKAASGGKIALASLDRLSTVQSLKNRQLQLDGQQQQQRHRTAKTPRTPRTA